MEGDDGVLIGGVVFGVLIGGVDGVLICGVG